MRREIGEETGIITTELGLLHVSEMYVRYPEFDFIFHVFKLNFTEKPQTRVSLREHKEHRWVTPCEALNLELMRDEDAVIEYFYKK
jgi:8-oxo-dGTP pyrophosphatase MutT (NUDIX family)